ncbi:hypothetical protein Hanom_Chr07g00681601 [Helianthus anomalus]
MSPRVRTRHWEFTAELAWSSSGSRSGITPAVERTLHPPPPPPQQCCNKKDSDRCMLPDKQFSCYRYL